MSRGDRGEFVEVVRAQLLTSVVSRMLPGGRMVCSLITSVLAVLLSFAATLQAADPPKIERLFPAGGQRGSSFDVKLPGKPGDGDLNVWSDHGQLSFELSEKEDSAKVTIPEDAILGQHGVRFYNEHGATDLLPFLVGVVDERPEVEPNNKVDEAQAIETLPVTVNGVLEKSGDTDLYAVELKPSVTLIASMDANRSLGSPMDGVMQLLNSSGTVVAQNDDDHGMDPQIVFTSPDEGTYFVRTFAFPATPNSTIRLAGAATYIYRLTLTTGPFVDHCRPAEVKCDAETTVTLHGWNLMENQQAVKVPAFEGDKAILTGPSAVPFVVRCAEFAAAVELPESPQSVEIPSSTTGVVSMPRQSDVYIFTGKKDQRLTVTVSSQDLNSPLDPIVTIDSEDGKRIKEVDDGTRDDPDAVASFKLPKDGKYQVRVEDLFGNGGERFVYVMTIQETRPAYSLSVKANAFVVEADKDLEIPVTVTRTNSFAEEISVVAEGLPDGITAEPVTSQPNGDTAKSVTLRIKRGAKSTAFSGVFRIVGESKEGSDQRTAEAPIPNVNARTTGLWLTVLQPPEKEKEEAVASDPKTETKNED